VYLQVDAAPAGHRQHAPLQRGGVAVGHEHAVDEQQPRGPQRADAGLGLRVYLQVDAAPAGHRQHAPLQRGGVAVGHEHAVDEQQPRGPQRADAGGAEHTARVTPARVQQVHLRGGTQQRLVGRSPGGDTMQLWLRSLLRARPPLLLLPHQAACR
jgi:hypothetical protein